uniref:Uncharacterized protein n=1 Tax=Acrobeloides nanus TaxID=290746 RepID=A0A914BZU5_9BILA
MMIFSLLAYFSGDWRTLTRTSAALAIPAIIAICILSESPRFLIQRGRLDEAKRVIQKMCRIDGRNFDEAGLDRVLAEENQILLESKSKGRSYTCLFLLYFFYLFYTTKFAKYTIALGFSLLVTSTMTHLLLFNMRSFSGSIYWNAIFIAGIPYVMNMSIALLERYVKYVGRKMIHCGVLIFAEVWLVAMIFIIYTGLGRFSLLSSIASLFIMGMCSQLYILNKVVSMELFPTCLRPRSIVFSQSFIRLGAVISPQILLLGIFWRPLPYALMLILVVANQFLFHFTIPETKGQPLNDHMPGPEELIFRNICRNNASRDEMILQDREATQKLNENED